MRLRPGHFAFVLSHDLRTFDWQRLSTGFGQSEGGDGIEFRESTEALAKAHHLSLSSTNGPVDAYSGVFLVDPNLEHLILTFRYDEQHTPPDPARFPDIVRVLIEKKGKRLGSYSEGISARDIRLYNEFEKYFAWDGDQKIAEYNIPLGRPGRAPQGVHLSLIKRLQIPVWPAVSGPRLPVQEYGFSGNVTWQWGRLHVLCASTLYFDGPPREDLLPFARKVFADYYSVDPEQVVFEGPRDDGSANFLKTYLEAGEALREAEAVRKTPIDPSDHEPKKNRRLIQALLREHVHGVLYFVTEADFEKNGEGAWFIGVTVSEVEEKVAQARTRAEEARKTTGRQSSTGRSDVILRYGGYIYITDTGRLMVYGLHEREVIFKNLHFEKFNDHFIPGDKLRSTIASKLVGRQIGAIDVSRFAPNSLVNNLDLEYASLFRLSFNDLKRGITPSDRAAEEWPADVQEGFIRYARMLQKYSHAIFEGDLPGLETLKGVDSPRNLELFLRADTIKSLKKSLPELVEQFFRRVGQMRESELLGCIDEHRKARLGGQPQDLYFIYSLSVNDVMKAFNSPNLVVRRPLAPQDGLMSLVGGEAVEGLLVEEGGASYEEVVGRLRNVAKAKGIELVVKVVAYDSEELPALANSKTMVDEAGRVVVVLREVEGLGEGKRVVALNDLLHEEQIARVAMEDRDRFESDTRGPEKSAKEMSEVLTRPGATKEEIETQRRNNAAEIAALRVSHEALRKKDPNAEKTLKSGMQLAAREGLDRIFAESQPYERTLDQELSFLRSLSTANFSDPKVQENFRKTCERILRRMRTVSDEQRLDVLSALSELSKKLRSPGPGRGSFLLSSAFHAGQFLAATFLVTLTEIAVTKDLNGFLMFLGNMPVGVRDYFTFSIGAGVGSAGYGALLELVQKKLTEGAFRGALQGAVERSLLRHGFAGYALSTQANLIVRNQVALVCGLSLNKILHQGYTANFWSDVFLESASFLGAQIVVVGAETVVVKGLAVAGRIATAGEKIWRLKAFTGPAGAAIAIGELAAQLWLAPRIQREYQIASTQASIEWELGHALNDLTRALHSRSAGASQPDPELSIRPALAVQKYLSQLSLLDMIETIQLYEQKELDADANYGQIATLSSSFKVLRTAGTPLSAQYLQTTQSLWNDYRDAISKDWQNLANHTGESVRRVAAVYRQQPRSLQEFCGGSEPTLECALSFLEAQRKGIDSLVQTFASLSLSSAADPILRHLTETGALESQPWISLNNRISPTNLFEALFQFGARLPQKEPRDFFVATLGRIAADWVQDLDQAPQRGISPVVRTRLPGPMLLATALADDIGFPELSGEFEALQKSLRNRGSASNVPLFTVLPEALKSRGKVSGINEPLTRLMNKTISIVLPAGVPSSSRLDTLSGILLNRYLLRSAMEKAVHRFAPNPGDLTPASRSALALLSDPSTNAVALTSRDLGNNRYRVELSVGDTHVQGDVALPSPQGFRIESTDFSTYDSAGLVVQIYQEDTDLPRLGTPILLRHRYNLSVSANVTDQIESLCVQLIQNSH
ncbi:MAG: hypothetical protein V1495_02410 [Pseudomonadota bacterium]